MKEKKAKSEPLPPKRERFARNFIENGGRKQKAAEDAGFAPGAGAAVTASRLLRNAKVLERIKELSSHSNVRVPEIVGTLASHMRADMADFFPDNAVVKRAREMGVSHLIREIEIDERLIPSLTSAEPIRLVRTKLKLHDSQRAAQVLGKYKGLEQAARENDADVRRKTESIEDFIERAYQASIKENAPMTKEEIAQGLLARRPDLAPYVPREWVM